MKSLFVLSAFVFLNTSAFANTTRVCKSQAGDVLTLVDVGHGLEAQFSGIDGKHFTGLMNGTCGRKICTSIVYISSPEDSTWYSDPRTQHMRGDSSHLYLYSAGSEGAHGIVLECGVN